MTIKTDVQREVSKQRRKARNARYYKKWKTAKDKRDRAQAKQIAKRDNDRAHDSLVQSMRDYPALSIMPK